MIIVHHAVANFVLVFLFCFVLFLCLFFVFVFFFFFFVFFCFVFVFLFVFLFVFCFVFVLFCFVLYKNINVIRSHDIQYKIIELCLWTSRPLLKLGQFVVFCRKFSLHC